MRWYELDETANKTYAKSRLPEDKHPIVLCRTDSYDITGESFSDLRAERSTSSLTGNDWAITFKVRKDHQQNMADLTQKADTYLAIILDGKVHSAPHLREQLRTAGQITGGFSEGKARALANLLGSERLPVRLALRP